MDIERNGKLRWTSSQAKLVAETHILRKVNPSSLKNPTIRIVRVGGPAGEPARELRPIFQIGSIESQLAGQARLPY
jgi:hypothetical protein